MAVFSTQRTLVWRTKNRSLARIIIQGQVRSCSQVDGYVHLVVKDSIALNGPLPCEVDTFFSFC